MNLLKSLNVDLRFCSRCGLGLISVALFTYLMLFHVPVSGHQKGQENLATKLIAVGAAKNVGDNKSTHEEPESPGTSVKDEYGI